MFAAAVERLNTAVLATFGREVVVTTLGGSTVLTGVYTAPLTGADAVGLPFQRPDPGLWVKTAAIAATGAKAGDSVTVDGTDYFIANMAADDAGMTEVSLRPI